MAPLGPAAAVGGNMTVPTHYDLLGVASSASAREIKAGYRAAVRAAHPDVGGDAAQFVLVQAAYETLSDAFLRSVYDRSLSPTAAATPGLDPSRYQQPPTSTVEVEDVAGAAPSRGAGPRWVALLVAALGLLLVLFVLYAVLWPLVDGTFIGQLRERFGAS